VRSERNRRSCRLIERFLSNIEEEANAGHVAGVPRQKSRDLQDVARQNGGNGLIVKSVLYQH
jgi:hypothetical protein